MCPAGYPIQETQNWQAGFLPGIYEGAYLDTQHTAIEQLIEHIRNGRVSAGSQRDELDLLAKLNQRHLEARQNDEALEARIRSFELGFRMQTEAADAFDVSREPKHVREAYGEHPQGRQLLIARRLVERGVRVVQILHRGWDQHGNLPKDLRSQCLDTDQPTAALLIDLKRRGLLDSTLVVWGGEFGRTPGAQGADGRDHHPYGFSVWLAGGGIGGGRVHGATDDFGYRAVSDPCSVADLHATILHLLGFDHTKLTYRYAGRDFRLTDVHGNVVKDVLA
jgi:uncharacterized protein (DUF1501 family)